MYHSWMPGYGGPLAELEGRRARLAQLKAALDRARPLPSATAQSLRRALALEYTFNSNAIEGNTLTLMETKVVVEDGLTIGGKTVREHLEAINHSEAIEYIEDLAQNPTPLHERTLKDIHSLVLKNIDQENAGRWRRQNVVISGASHTPPEALRVPELMEQFFTWRAERAGQLPVIERAARLHADLVNIHPFIDGNGRTARLVMNLELLKSGYPLAIVPLARRLEYYDCLDQVAKDGNYGPFVGRIYDFVEEGFGAYANILGLNFEKGK